MTTILRGMFEKINMNCIYMSLDDFYLTGEEQDNLSSVNPKNPLLQYRGNGKLTFVINYFYSV